MFITEHGRKYVVPKSIILPQAQHCQLRVSILLNVMVYCHCLAFDMESIKSIFINPVSLLSF